MGVLFNCLFLLCFHSEGSHRCCIRIHVHNIVMNALSLCYLKICTSAHANTHCVFQHIEINFFFNVSNFVRDLMAKISFSKKVLESLYLDFFFMYRPSICRNIYTYVCRWIKSWYSKNWSKYIKVFIFFSNVTSVRIFNISCHYC